MKYISENKYKDFYIGDYEYHDYSTITCSYMPSRNEDIIIEYNDNFYLFKNVHNMVSTKSFSSEVSDQFRTWHSFGFSCDEIIKSDSKKDLLIDIL